MTGKEKFLTELAKRNVVKEIKELAEEWAESSHCPDDYGLKITCENGSACLVCVECWKQALDAEYKGEE